MKKIGNLKRLMTGVLTAFLILGTFIIGSETALAANTYDAPTGTVGESYTYSTGLSVDGDPVKDCKLTNVRLSGDSAITDWMEVTVGQDDNGDCFIFSGTPTKEGKYKFKVEFHVTGSNHYQDGRDVTWNFNITINASTKPYIAPKTIRGTVNENLSVNLEVKNFDGSVDSWKITDGEDTLKSYELTFDNGKISGTPQKEGSFDIGVTAFGDFSKAFGDDAKSLPGTVTIKIGTKSDDDDDDDDDDDHHEEVKWSPDSLTVRYFVDGHYATNLKSGKIQQGEAAKAIFTASKPAGWTEAFSFNLSFDDKTDYTLKNGILTLYIPSDYIKAGRQYALMGMDQGGQVHIYADTDAELGTVTTAPLNLQGFAMELIYKD